VFASSASASDTHGSNAAHLCSSVEIKKVKLGH